MDDADTIERVLAGDSAAYAVLVRKYHRDILGFIHRIVRDAHLAEDIGQEVFLDAYKSLARFDPKRGTPFGAWLCVLARNRCIDALRARRRSQVLPVEDAPDRADEGSGPEECLAGLEQRQALDAAVASLDEPFRSTVRLSLRGHSLLDIALADGVGTATVKTRLFRAREKLRRLLAVSLGGIRHERPL